MILRSGQTNLDLEVCLGLEANLGQQQHTFEFNGNEQGETNKASPPTSTSGVLPTPPPFKSLTSSCSSKVLMLGGYTILRSPNPGVSLATSARFRSTFSVPPQLPADEGDTITLTVESSQFHTVYTCGRSGCGSSRRSRCDYS
ncbi:hypothetical protein TrCOL_g8713 [Triparma columacea]|uniref:Uncharacterized protein n=1 Tax=Triparma columacea TaxID=722753 RepID=A0A9W7GFN7_9STRA|nr:hypothetical protein TrCOL_g8713 [Triparma columacea]